MANYIMGQYRYTGTEEVTSLLNTYPEDNGTDNSKAFKPVYTPSGITRTQGETVENYYYQDVLIPFKSVLDTDVFYIDMNIARFSSDTIYNLKMVKSAEEEINFPNYETIATITVPKNTSSQLTPQGVALYSYGKDKEGIYKTHVGKVGGTNSLQYKDGVLTYNGTKVPYHNVVFLLPTWEIEIKEGQEQKYQTGTMFSTNYLSGQFDCLLLEIQRIPEDKSIVSDKKVTINDETKTINILGRFLNVDDDKANHLDVKIYQINELLTNADIKAVKQLGVWGRPGLPLAINGEEIKIGPSGYFELKNYDITSFGVFATDKQQDKFTVDYLYEKK